MDVRRRATMLMAGVAALGLSVGLSGCEGSDGIVTETPSPTSVTTPLASPSPSPSGGASATATLSPTASPGALLSDEELLKVLPPGAEMTDLQGALVTAAYYSELLGNIFEAGDTTVWRALATVDCNYCRSQSESIDKLVSDGGAALGGGVVVDQSATRGTLSDSDSGTAYVRIQANIAGLYRVDADGTRELASPSSTVQLDYEMRLVGAVWRINGVQADPVP